MWSLVLVVSLAALSVLGRALPCVCCRGGAAADGRGDRAGWQGCGWDPASDEHTAFEAWLDTSVLGHGVSGQEGKAE